MSKKIRTVQLQVMLQEGQNPPVEHTLQVDIKGRLTAQSLRVMAGKLADAVVKTMGLK